jgi:glutamate/tyrosine decarboxylase-like PLP-dependent enzyme
MTNPTENRSRPSRDEIAGVLEVVAREAAAYFDGLDERPVRTGDLDRFVRRIGVPLPETGQGAAAALLELIEHGREAAINSAGPRFFHFVMGGTTPAALGADWLATALDQVAYAWVTSPLAVQLELECLSWLRQLFGLTVEGAGVMTTGATMANFVGLAAARQWWGEQHGVDISEKGFEKLPSVPVLSSGYVHASTVKALAMLGIGRANIRKLSSDEVGRLDVAAIGEALRELRGAPAIIVGNAGEVNAGDFDPIEQLADLSEEHGAWLHVDGAFGLFAKLSPRTENLVAGTERAHSVTVDGHKWLNVPYDCGFAFVNDATLVTRTFAYSADYLPDPEDPRPNMGVLGPESSRRARALAVWATLRAYGHQGYRDMVEGHLSLAQRLARRVDEAPDLERLADVPLNIVCFRYNPGGMPERKLNMLNRRLGEAIVEDGRVYVGTTQYGERTALRPAIVNWRTRERDIDLFVDVVRELGARVTEEG